MPKRADIERKLRPSVIEASALRMLANKARSDRLKSEDFERLQFAVAEMHVAPSLSKDLTFLVAVRFKWKNPYASAGDSRGLTFEVPETEIREDGSLTDDKLREITDQIDIRGEMYFFRLLRHFPKRLKAVHTNHDGRVTVEFKNGRTVQTHESQLDDRGFLAACVMIHDL